jgi:hypothetical protein
MPATGPFSALRIPPLTPEVEKLFMTSFNSTVDGYKALLANMGHDGPPLPNANFDAGGATVAGKYRGTDEAYARLLDKLAGRQFAGVQPDLRQNILDYYRGLNASKPALASTKDRAAQTKLLNQIEQLRAIPEPAVPQP